MSVDLREVREQWRQKLQSGSIDDCVEALRQISSHESVTGLTSDVIPLAGHDDDEIRMWASEALESSIQAEVAELLVLIQMLESTEDSEICYWSATILGRLGSDAASAAPVLEACVRKSMYLPARERATWALAQIGPAASIALPTLKDIAESSPPRLQRLAIEAIDRIEHTSADQSSPSEDAA
ncbi:MAG: HEAT repeat domain-containing protein [Planctomycetota bacterium]